MKLGSKFVAVALLAAVAACGDDGQRATSGDADEVETAGTTPCAERHMVVIDFFNVLTPANREQHEAVHWLQDPNDEPEARPGGPELAQRYRELGYEILYLHASPNDILIDGQPITDAIADWLERHGFPVGEGVHFWSWEPDWERDTPEMTPLALMTQELIRLAAEGVDVSFAYSGRPERVEAFISGGVPRERIFTVMEAVDVDGTQALPGDDLEAHLATVETPAEALCDTDEVG